MTYAESMALEHLIDKFDLRTRGNALVLSSHKGGRMKAIVTKYHGPTTFKGSRISASDEDGNRITISYPYELSGEAVHRKAAEALKDKMGWKGNLTGGSLKSGYVFVFTD